jgi:hypothetical protein
MDAIACSCHPLFDPRGQSIASVLLQSPWSIPTARRLMLYVARERRFFHQHCIQYTKSFRFFTSEIALLPSYQRAPHDREINLS